MSGVNPPSDRPAGSEPGVEPTERPAGGLRRLARRVGRVFVLLVVVVAVLAAGGCLERLFYYPMRGVSDTPPGVEDVFVNTPDGLRLHAWFVPAGWPAEPAAKDAVGSVLVVHGNAGRVEHHFPFVEGLPARGFNVFLFDYRGYGQSDKGRLNRQALYRDTQAALEALLARPDVDPDRVVVYAQSLGAAFAFELMCERPEPKALVSVAAFTSWSDVAMATCGASGRPGSFACWLGQRLIGPGLDPIENIGRITDRPILLIHGDADEIVPYEHATRLLEAAGPDADVTLYTVPGGDHNSLNVIDATLDDRVADFLRRSLDAASSPNPADP